MRRLAPIAFMVVALALGSGSSAQAASKPQPPPMKTSASVRIPVTECYDPLKILGLHNTKTARWVSSEISIRKSGMSLPYDSGDLCGYMGSGTFNLTIKTEWTYKATLAKKVPVKVANPLLGYVTCGADEDPEYDDCGYADTIHIPVTCTMSARSTADLQVTTPAAYYQCATDLPFRIEDSIAYTLGKMGQIDSDALPDSANYFVGDERNEIGVIMPAGAPPPPQFKTSADLEYSAFQAEDAEALETYSSDGFIGSLGWGTDVPVPEWIITGYTKKRVTEWVDGRLLTQRAVIRVTVGF